MSNLNENQSGVFGGVNMNGNPDYTSYFDNLNQNAENVQVNNGGIFENNQANYYSNSYNGTNNEVGTNQNTNNAGVFGSIKFDTGVENASTQNTNIFQPIGQEKAITKQGLWTKIRAFLFQEIDLNAPIKVVLTPQQQKIEDEINEFLHQEVTFKGIVNFFKGKK